MDRSEECEAAAATLVKQLQKEQQHAPTWRHPCFVDGLSCAEFMTAAQLPRARPPGGIVPALRLTSQLIQAALPGVKCPASSAAASSTRDALLFAAELASLAPVDVTSRWTTRTLHAVLSKLVSRLRSTAEDEMVLVPAGWVAHAAGADAAGAGAHVQHASIMFALRRRSADAWDMAICTAYGGREYHPTYRRPLQVDDDSFDPILVLPGVPSHAVVDSAPWLALFRGLAEPYASAADAGRYVYEVLLPFLVEAPLPAAVGRRPPPAVFRRRPAALGDPSHLATTLEAVCGLMLLAGASPTAALSFSVSLRVELLRASATELEGLLASHDGRITSADAAILTAATRGLCRTAVAAAASAEGEEEVEEVEEDEEDEGGGEGGTDGADLATPLGDPPTGRRLAPHFLTAADRRRSASAAAVLVRKRSSSLPSATIAEGAFRAAVAAANAGGHGRGRRRASPVDAADVAAAALLLHDAYDVASRVRGGADELLCRGLGFVPPTLRLPAPSDATAASTFPLFGRLLRAPASVEDLAGDAPPPPFLRAVQLTAVPESVDCAHDVVVTLQRALHECTLLAAQEAMVSNSACLRVALLQHLITQALPMPLPLDHPERSSRCFWAVAKSGLRTRRAPGASLAGARAARRPRSPPSVAPLPLPDAPLDDWQRDAPHPSPPLSHAG